MHPEQAADVPPVPEQPALAPNVQVVGELRESGFQDRQWLLQRDDQFIQVSELLYRVAEQANGKRTLEEIATGVTKSTDWMVTAEHVRILVQKLIPLGVITTSDGAAISGAISGSGKRTYSPLMLNMRMRLLSPSLIDPITNVLQRLYMPPILILVLLASLVAHGWLYLVHGVTDSIVEVLYVPGFLIPVLGLLLVSDLFHELGHASALRYGGGKVRTIGVGFYLVYPAFYTDTTDNYRLGRWARVRTDLGGFYFHLIFALGVIASYLVSGQEFLLFVVVMINIAIIYQLLPFVRFDGYWALADLTGIPDFFSQMGPFLASIFPLPGGKGHKLPALKPWVRAVFTIYIVLTLPVLTLLSFLAITKLPSLVTIIQRSFLIQMVEFSHAYSQSDLVGMVGAVAQMLILALPLLGMLYLIYRVTRRVLALFGNWSIPALQRVSVIKDG